MDICCKDIISNLPEALICHILSFLTTKEAALTSLLTQKWRYLFACRPILDFDDSVLHEVPILELDAKHSMFMDFVDRVLSLQGNSTIKSFSLQCQDGVYPDCVTRWITSVMERGVSDLDLRVTLNWHDDSMPASVFVSNSLVRLRVEAGNGVIIHVGDVFLPKLKTLYLDLVLLTYCGFDNALGKLISSCPVLEELVMINLSWQGYWRRPFSSKTLKRLTFHCQVIDNNPFTVTFDTPNLVYLEYSDHIADEYKKLNFDSLVEASIGLQMTSVQYAHATNGYMVADATDLIMGISNVRILHLFGNTL
ncbi:PREDICTED: putative F-box/FBD/LRR-repeat protein At3g59240 [Camelina sativa]|uniref:F-box/FBD/LRR-repeat protein At3g59240 n=1 Tax=Camelina sativa TaxID=90675 RepID=A0ABM0SNA1_CAMSA|nr:PREDICTED: putative F-box/FBD/LRR-repeat protein At3g59240 [Camelina sativa]XP_010413727.1 PREDICTED: putative F-box/FBD/LRR-repeat protein At3g59240 [Camelina sativa]